MAKGRQPLMPPAMIPADLRLRTCLMAWGASAVVIGVGGLFLLHAHLNTLSALSTAAPELAAEKFHRLATLVGAGLLLLTSSAAGVGIALACRTLRTGQYPPPGLRVVRDTPLRTGRQARSIAFFLLSLAVVVFLGGLGVGVMLWWATSVPPSGVHRPLEQAATSMYKPWWPPVLRS